MSKKLYNRFNVKTVSMEFSKGSSGMIISASDMQAVLSACDADELTKAHFDAAYQLGDDKANLVRFERLLKPFMYNRLLQREPSINTKTLLKYHMNIINALDDVTDCVFKYLTRNKIKETRIRAFMPDIKADTFRRHYLKFLRGVIGELESKLDNLEYQIYKKVSNFNTYAEKI